MVEVGTECSFKGEDELFAMKVFRRRKHDI